MEAKNITTELVNTVHMRNLNNTRNMFKTSKDIKISPASTDEYFTEDAAGPTERNAVSKLSTHQDTFFKKIQTKSSCN